MKFVRVHMLKCRDQLQAQRYYNLPQEIASDLVFNGFATWADETKPAGPSEIKPAAPTEFKAKKKRNRAPMVRES